MAAWHGGSGTIRKLAQGSALRVTNVFVGVLVSFFLMPFVVHVLGDRVYGIWALVGTFMGYSGLLDFGLSFAVTRYLAAALGARDERECNQIFNTALALYLSIGMLVLVIGAVVATLAPHFSHTAADAALFRTLIVICSVSVALNFPVRVFSGVLEAQLRYERTAGFELLTLLLRATLIVTVLRSGFGILGLAWVTLLSILPAGVLYFYFSQRDVPCLRLRPNFRARRTARQLFSYSTFSFLTQMANLFRFQAAAVIVASFMGLAAVTHYRIASTMATYFIDVMTAMLGVLVSVFSRQEGAKDAEAIRKTFLFASKISAAIACFIGFGLIAWGKAFIQRWMGPRYLDAYPCLAILALAYTFALCQSPSLNLLFGVAKHRYLALLNLVEGAVNVVASVLLVRHYGLAGVAIGALIPMTVAKLFFQPMYACRVTGINVMSYFRQMGATFLLIGAALVLPSVVTAASVAPDYTRLALVGMLSATCYFPPLWWLLLRPAERQTLLRLIPRTKAPLSLITRANLM